MSPFGDWHRWWNFVLKIYFITTSAYIVFIMTRVFARTREREKAMKLGGYATLGSLVLTPVMTGIFHKWHPFTFGEVGTSRFPVSESGVTDCGSM